MKTAFKIVLMTVLAGLMVGCAYDGSYPYSSYGNGYRNGAYRSGFPPYGDYSRGYRRYCPDDD